MSEQKKNKKHPILAVVLSIIAPGLGHFYVGKFARGAVLFILNIIIGSMIGDPFVYMKELEASDSFNIKTLYVLAGLVLIIIAALDSKKTADQNNKQAKI